MKWEGGCFRMVQRIFTDDYDGDVEKYQIATEHTSSQRGEGC